MRKSGPSEKQNSEKMQKEDKAFSLVSFADFVGQEGTSHEWKEFCLSGQKDFLDKIKIVASLSDKDLQDYVGAVLRSENVDMTKLAGKKARQHPRMESLIEAVRDRKVGLFARPGSMETEAKFEGFKSVKEAESAKCKVQKDYNEPYCTEMMIALTIDLARAGKREDILEGKIWELRDMVATLPLEPTSHPTDIETGLSFYTIWTLSMGFDNVSRLKKLAELMGKQFCRTVNRTTAKESVWILHIAKGAELDLQKMDMWDGLDGWQGFAAQQVCWKDQDVFSECDGTRLRASQPVFVLVSNSKSLSTQFMTTVEIQLKKELISFKERTELEICDPRGMVMSNQKYQRIRKHVMSLDPGDILKLSENEFAEMFSGIAKGLARFFHREVVTRCESDKGPKEIFRVQRVVDVLPTAKVDDKGVLDLSKVAVPDELYEEFEGIRIKMQDVPREVCNAAIVLKLNDMGMWDDDLGCLRSFVNQCGRANEVVLSGNYFTSSKVYDDWIVNELVNARSITVDVTRTYLFKKGKELYGRVRKLEPSQLEKLVWLESAEFVFGSNWKTVFEDDEQADEKSRR